MKKSRITVLDSHGLFVEVLQHVLERRGYSCRALATGSRSTAALVRRVEDSRPDLVVLGMELRPDSADGSEVLRELADRGHRVVAVTEHDLPVLQGEAIEGGAHAVVAKSRSLEDFLDVVTASLDGTEVLPCSERRRLVATYRDARDHRGAGHRRIASLSRREQEILRHLMGGRTVHEIAKLATVSEHTVRTQVKSLLGKLDVNSQIQAVALAHDAGWGARVSGVRSTGRDVPGRRSAGPSPT